MFPREIHEFLIYFFLRMMFSCLQKQARLKLMHTLVTMLPAEKEEEEEVSLLNSN